MAGAGRPMSLASMAANQLVASMDPVKSALNNWIQIGINYAEWLINNRLRSFWLVAPSNLSDWLLLTLNLPEKSGGSRMIDATESNEIPLVLGLDYYYLFIFFFLVSISYLRRWTCQSVTKIATDET